MRVIGTTSLMFSSTAASGIASALIGLGITRGIVGGDTVNHCDFGIQYTTEHFIEVLTLAEQPLRPAPSGTTHKALPK